MKLPLKIESRAEYFCKRIKIDVEQRRNDTVRTDIPKIKGLI